MWKQNNKFIIRPPSTRVKWHSHNYCCTVIFPRHRVFLLLTQPPHWPGGRSSTDWLQESSARNQRVQVWGELWTPAWLTVWGGGKCLGKKCLSPTGEGFVFLGNHLPTGRKVRRVINVCGVGMCTFNWNRLAKRVPSVSAAEIESPEVATVGARIGSIVKGNFWLLLVYCCG